MMFPEQFILTFVLGFLFFVNRCIDGESSTCLTVYKEGGAPAVFQSPKCPRWKLSDYRSNQRSQNGLPSTRCHSAMHQGRRKTQEDRTLCALDIRIPFPGPTGITEVTVGVVAVFDGHNGAQASDMASRLLLEYFTLHTYFLLDTTFSVLLGNYVGRLPSKGEEGYFFRKFKQEELDQHVVNLGRFKLDLSAISDGTFHLKILREALLKSLHDIDSVFAKDAFRGNYVSGSTATVIITADSQILVANIGDSKALLCSEIHQSPHEARATFLRLYRQHRSGGAFPFLKDYRSLKTAAASGWNFLIAKELTKDHHPDRDEERARVESAGGYVSEWGGVARVNGQLAVSRAIGDVYFKSYGVVSLPEVNGWQSLTVNDSYLVAVTDGVFEKLNSQDICDIVWESESDNIQGELAYSCSFSLADCIINAALEKGSTDNMAAVALPLMPITSFKSVVGNMCDGAGKLDCSALEYQKHLNKHSELMELDRGHPVVAVFDRLLVERKQSNSGCFYLLENLNEVDDYTFWIEKDNDEYNYDQPHALPGCVDHSIGGPLSMYGEQNTCMLFAMTVNANDDQCTKPEGFARLLGLLGSIPLHNNGSDEHTTLDSRYILKKRYDRGSYGEVWLAFQWNCSSKAFQQSSMNEGFHFNITTLRSNDEHMHTSSADDCNDQCRDENMFILKRIMVERGPAVYLSGLREKYFGEIFLNASRFLRGIMPDEVSNSFYGKSQSDVCHNLDSNDSVGQRMENCWSSENIFYGKKGLLDAAYEDGLDHIARFVESFESRSNEIWLVFRHEGVSLSKLLYTAEEVGTNEQSDDHSKRVQILHPSKWWHWLKTTKAGQEEMRNLIWQLLVALKSCHDRNITHRDIKPENMVICIEDQESGRCLKEFPSGDKNYTLKMRIIDFGSALDEFTMKHLYGSVGPSRSEQTSEYAPPEALLNSSWHQGPMQSIVKYDMWSVGTVILELILGSPNVFQINAKTRALLDKHLDGWNENIRELAYKLRSFMEMCILIPGVPTRIHHTKGGNGHGYVSPVPWKCSEEFFSRQIKSKDPLKMGFPNIWALRLVRELLHWNPEDRISIDHALQHPYFSTTLSSTR